MLDSDAPWFVVPADKRWYRDLVVSDAIAGAIESLDLRWPESTLDLSAVRLDWPGPTDAPGPRTDPRPHSGPDPVRGSGR